MPAPAPSSRIEVSHSGGMVATPTVSDRPAEAEDDDRDRGDDVDERRPDERRLVLSDGRPGWLRGEQTRQPKGQCRDVRDQQQDHQQRGQ
jgi:hypothetical protein